MKENEMDKKFLPLLEKIEALLKKGDLVIAIDGGSASGKTTLAENLRNMFGASVFHIDDFFLPKSRRTRERMAEIGGNIDRERFLCEVLHPVCFKQDVLYIPYDCKEDKMKEPVRVPPKRLTIIEGAYSTHPVLAIYYDFTVFLDIDKDTQRERILKRNTEEEAKRFFEEWIPKEDAFFVKTKAKSKCDLIIEI